MHEILGLAAEFQNWLAGRVMTDTDVPPRQAVGETRAHGLGRRLLGGKAPRQKVGRFGIEAKLLEFRRRQDAFGKAFAKALQVLLHAPDPDDIGADAENHVRERIIKRFISRTASPRPVKMARATMA